MFNIGTYQTHVFVIIYLFNVNINRFKKCPTFTPNSNDDIRIKTTLKLKSLRNDNDLPTHYLSNNIKTRSPGTNICYTSVLKQVIKYSLRLSKLMTSQYLMEMN